MSGLNAFTIDAGPLNALTPSPNLRPRNGTFVTSVETGKPSFVVDGDRVLFGSEFVAEIEEYLLVGVPPWLGGWSGSMRDESDAVGYFSPLAVGV